MSRKKNVTLPHSHRDTLDLIDPTETVVPRAPNLIVANMIQYSNLNWVRRIRGSADDVLAGQKHPVIGALETMANIGFGLMFDRVMLSDVSHENDRTNDPWHSFFEEQATEHDEIGTNPFDGHDGESLIAVPWGLVVVLGEFACQLNWETNGKTVDAHALARLVGIRGEGRGKVTYFGSARASDSTMCLEPYSVLHALDASFKLGREVLAGERPIGITRDEILPVNAHWTPPGVTADENQPADLRPYDGRDPNGMIPVKWWTMVQFMELWAWMLREKERVGQIDPFVFAQRIGVRGFGSGHSPSLKTSLSSRYGPERRKIAVMIADLLARSPTLSNSEAFGKVRDAHETRFELSVIADAWNLHGPWARQTLDLQRRGNDEK